MCVWLHAWGICAIAAGCCCLPYWLRFVWMFWMCLSTFCFYMSLQSLWMHTNFTQHYLISAVQICSIFSPPNAYRLVCFFVCLIEHKMMELALSLRKKPTGTWRRKEPDKLVCLETFASESWGKGFLLTLPASFGGCFHVMVKIFCI